MNPQKHILLALLLTIITVSATVVLASGFITGASISVNPEAATQGSYVVVDLHLGYMSGQWYAVFLSSNSVPNITPGDIPLKLAVNRATQGYQTVVRIPSNLKAGTYYIKLSDDFGDCVLASLLVSQSSSNVLLQPSSGPTGSLVRVYLENSQPVSSVNVLWNSPAAVPVASASTDSLGFAATGFNVPANSTMGENAVIVEVGSPSKEYVSFFDVLPNISVSPAGGGFSVPAGQAYQQAEISGTGLPPGELSQDSISVWSGGSEVSGALNSAAFVSASGPSAGKLSPISVTISSALNPGYSYYLEMDIGGRVVTSGNFGASLPNSASPQVGFTPASGYVGSEIRAYGYGFSADSTIDVALVHGGQPISYSVATTSDANGGFSIRFYVPDTPSSFDYSPGSYELVVTDSVSGTSVDAGSFGVLPTPDPSSLLAGPGGTMEIYFSGLPVTFNLSAAHGGPILNLNGHPVNVSLLLSNGSIVPLQEATSSGVKLYTTGGSIVTDSNGDFPYFSTSKTTQSAVLIIQVPKDFKLESFLTVTIYGRSLVQTGATYSLSIYTFVMVG